MIVFQTQPPINSGEQAKIVILFGTGLIGSSVYNSIHSHAEYVSSFFPYDWHSPEQSSLDLSCIYQYLLNLINSGPVDKAAVSHIAFVWCAGNAGFSASEDDIQLEFKNYELALGLVSKLLDSFPEIEVLFHLISSAGGLFEGQRYIDKHSVPTPLRCYGQLKYGQEKRLLGIGSRLVKQIYRPASVYGYIGPGQRMGLIPTLILNGIQNTPSIIFGNQATLRDYIFNDNIGAYINRKLFDIRIEGEAGIHLLASGKPSSIFEVQHFVEQVIGKKIYLAFHSTRETENTKNITVNSSALPVGWSPTDIKTGIRCVRDRVVSGDLFRAPVK